VNYLLDRYPHEYKENTNIQLSASINIHRHFSACYNAYIFYGSNLKNKKKRALQDAPIQTFYIVAKPFVDEH
jgi:hypothetical protein